VAWNRLRTVGIWFTHAYTAATTSTPRIEPAAGDRVVRWTLSEPAPETWWAVLRAPEQGAFEEVARVRAGPGVG